MPQFDDLTVVLTLKDRVDFTYRWMQWMQNQRFPYRIVIADGGGDKSVERHLKNAAAYPNLRYEYIRYPYDDSFAKFIAKLADVAGRVKTEFVISADNDDLIMLEPLERNLEFLRRMPDVHTLGPAHYRFRVHRSAPVSELVSAKGARVSVRRLRQVNNPGLESADPKVRLLEVAEKFYSDFIYYGIHRSGDYRKINRRLEQIGVERAIFFEWYTLYMYAVSGRVLLGRTEPFLLRQEDTSQHASATHAVENHANIFLLPDWSRQLYAMIDDLYGACSPTQADRVSFDEDFRRAFRKHMLSFMEFRALADRFRQYPTVYSWGRKAFAVYRGKHPVMRQRELLSNSSLRGALQFLRSYSRLQTSSTVGEQAPNVSHDARIG